MKAGVKVTDSLLKWSYNTGINFLHFKSNNIYTENVCIKSCLCHVIFRYGGRISITPKTWHKGITFKTLQQNFNCYDVYIICVVAFYFAKNGMQHFDYTLRQINVTRYFCFNITDIVQTYRRLWGMSHRRI